MTVGSPAVIDLVADQSGILSLLIESHKESVCPTPFQRKACRASVCCLHHPLAETGEENYPVRDGGSELA